MRRVSPSGVITTVAGDGTSRFGGDGGPATAAQLNSPFDVAAAADGSVLIADNNRVRRVDTGGTITTVAGDGTTSAGSIGDGGPATSAQTSAFAVSATADGGFLIADNDHHRIARTVPAGR